HPRRPDSACAVHFHQHQRNGIFEYDVASSSQPSALNSLTFSLTLRLTQGKASVINRRGRKGRRGRFLFLLVTLRPWRLIQNEASARIAFKAREWSGTERSFQCTSNLAGATTARASGL